MSTIGRPRFDLDAKVIRRLASEGLQQAAIAEKLQISLRTLGNHLARDSGLRAAFEAGRAEHRNRAVVSTHGAAGAARLRLEAGRQLLRKAERGNIRAMRSVLKMLGSE